MTKTERIIIIGDSAFAEIAYQYFQYDSPYEVVAFAVEQQYLTHTMLFGLPVICFEELEKYYCPQQHFFYAAIVYSQLNRLRTRLYLAAKAKGYRPASYISSRAFVWQNNIIGEHCFIFENNVIQPFVTLNDNIVLWSGNHIGHHSVIHDNCFIASHVVISGFVEIGKNCFIGVNATFANNISVADDCLIGAGALVVKNVSEDVIVKGNASQTMPSARRYSKIAVTQA
jgi:sugar O-acyltransferase (sialic acid O-acetyltransferase NeuD family)